MNTALLLVSLLITTGSWQGASAVDTTVPDSDLVVTDRGPVRGVVAADHRSFRGIPYAKAPVGELRWRAPERPERWSSPLDATTPSKACPQAGEVPQSEDCLKLSVTTPVRRESASGLPVMVWLHGGAFFRGAGRQYDPTRMVVRGDVVVVTVNYRLGALGFLADEALGENSNFGLRDQLAALRWVRGNIDAFGGDPNRITAMGGSAGGLSICSHLSTGKAPALFQRAILQSAPCDASFRTRQQGLADANEFREAAGCHAPNAAECLRSLPAERVLRAQRTITWSPTVGDEVLPRQPAEAFRAGEITGTELLIGSNLDEGRFGVGLTYDGRGEPVTADQYPKLVRDLYGSAADRILARYPLRNYRTPSLALAAVQTDYLGKYPPYSVCPTLWTERAAARSVPVYTYEFADRTAPPPRMIPGFPTGAQHGSEIQYLFDYSRAGEPLNDEQRALGDTMIDYWTSFARSGVPRADEAPSWPRFRTDSDVLSLGEAIRTVDLGDEHQCHFWREHAR